jgi:hypothetical protein
MKYLFASALVFLIAVAISGCGYSPREIRTESATETGISGTYSVILYGDRHGNDLESVAILAKEGGPYTFVPFAPEFDYRIVKHVDAKNALSMGKDFVSFHPDFARSELAGIVDEHGNLIGYEIRPLYHPFVYGLSDVLDVSYWKGNDTILVKVKLRQDIERRLVDSGAVHGHW